MISTNHTHAARSGFALLVTMVVVSVVLAVGLSLLDIIVKQLNLSITARDSELAFGAARSAVECAAKYIDGNSGNLGPPPTAFGGAPDCYGSGSLDSLSPPPASIVPGDQYGYELTWDIDGRSVCSEIEVHVVDASGGEVSYSDFNRRGLENESCSNGSTCVVSFARGFNRACNDTDSLRTVQREITILY